MHPCDIQPDYPDVAFRALVAPLIAGAFPELRLETKHRHRDGQAKLAEELAGDAGHEGHRREHRHDGEGGRHDMVIYKWLDQIKRREKITVYGTNTVRGYTYVGDVSKAIFDLVSNNIFNNGIIHIGGNEKVSIENLLTLFRRTTDKCDILFDRFDDVIYKPLSHYDVPVSFADTAKAERIIGFKPEHLFEKRVEKIILEYFKK